MTMAPISWLQGSTFNAASQLVGAIVIIYFILFMLFRTLRFLYALIPRDLSVRYGKNSWAVVTGASGGIGRGFSEELAKKGFNIVLISENQRDLATAAESIHKMNPNVQTKIIVTDFANSAQPGFFDKITQDLQGLDISILVNNVGVAGGGPFAEEPEIEIRNITIINTLPQVILTRRLIPQLLARKPRSAIVFLASIMGTRPFPFFTMYSATKVFSDFFARALAQEYPSLDVVALRPVYVSTNMTFNKELNFKTLSPSECALGLLGKLGHETSTAGHWRHAFYTFFSLTIIPDWLFKLVSRRACIKIGERFMADKERMSKTKTD